MIIEDDDEALSLLEIYLQAFSEIELIAKTTSPLQGIKLLKKRNPELVFLDIDMPGTDGLEIAKAIQENDLRTEVVFTTAHSRYAFRALHLEPLDYLLKPFGPEDIIAVINRYHTRTKKKELERKMDFLVKSNKIISKIKLPTRAGFIFINPDDIMLYRTEGNYCRICTKDNEQELIMLSIYKVIAIANSPQVFRVNRSAYINTHYLKRIEKKTRICYLSHHELTLETKIKRSNLSYFEKLNCCPVD
ncbi:MAG: LytR/AlgR family response regulator transcription factor [Mangrovibacterium sp.]